MAIIQLVVLPYFDIVHRFESFLISNKDYNLSL